MIDVAALCANARGGSTRQLPVSDAKLLLGDCGIETSPSFVVGSADEAAEVVARMGRTVVMKVVSPDIVHKSDVGGVKVGIQTAAAARAAFSEIMETVLSHRPGARIDGIMIEEMLSADWELVVGAVSDKVFGPVVMFGMGGVYVELLRDIVFRVAPVRRTDALAMIAECRMAKALGGFRGKAPVDMERLADAIVALSEFAWKWRDEIQEIEVNPVMARESRLVAADVRVIATSQAGAR